MADRRPRAPASVQEPPARYLQPRQTVLLDTCVVLDLLLLRQPFAAQACALFEQALLGLQASGARALTRHAARPVGTVRRGPVTRAVLDAALRSPMADFEDAVLAAAAQACGAQAIITRNVRDFALCGLPVYTPAQWLAAV